jgi:CVNH domain-containing protein
MKTTLGASVTLLLAAVACAQPAHAQRAPQGSYLASCRNVGMDGGRLVADCRSPDGAWHRTALDIGRCAGDIANIHGRLNCNRGPREGYGSNARGDWREGDGSNRHEEWRDAQRARCWHVLDPYERDRCWWGR